MEPPANEPGRAIAEPGHVSASPLAASVRAARLDSVGGAFLRLRPRLLGPGMLVVAVVLALGGEPPLRLGLLGLLVAVMLGGFVWESRRTRARSVSATWLERSLALTIGGITLASALTGGLPSPLLPMFFAPTVVCFAAFGRGRESTTFLALVALALVVLAFVRVLAPWPPIGSPRFEIILAASTLVSLALLRSGVGGLADAHARSEALLDRMRLAVLDESTERLRALESVGAKVAHEVRNPLASIKGLVQLLSKRAEGEREARRFAVVLAEVERLNAILDDYLSFSRPLQDLAMDCVAVDALLADVGAVLEASARERGVGVEVRAEPAVVLGDRRRLEAAILNLATNALAASEPGTAIALSCAAEGEELVIEVRDRGAGMDEATLARVGTPYFTTKERGAGLGVALARAAIAQHGGALGFASRVGEGTVATVRLPRSDP